MLITTKLLAYGEQFCHITYSFMYIRQLPVYGSLAVGFEEVVAAGKGAASEEAAIGG